MSTASDARKQLQTTIKRSQKILQSIADGEFVHKTLNRMKMKNTLTRIACDKTLSREECAKLAAVLLEQLGVKVIL